MSTFPTPTLRNGPATDVIPVTPSDTVPVSTLAIVRAIRAAVAGTVSIVTIGGDTRSLAFLAGETRAVACVYIRATGTTASGLEAMI